VKAPGWFAWGFLFWEGRGIKCGSQMTAINATAIGLDESLRRVLQGRTVLPVEMRPKLLFNPDSRSPNSFLPLPAAVLLLNVTTFLNASAL
jgi:ABC-2 type transport system permease protein